jgi:hypothetical protein
MLRLALSALLALAITTPAWAQWLPPLGTTAALLQTGMPLRLGQGPQTGHVYCLSRAVIPCARITVTDHAMPAGQYLRAFSVTAGGSTHHYSLFHAADGRDWLAYWNTQADPPAWAGYFLVQENSQ